MNDSSVPPANAPVPPSPLRPLPVTHPTEDQLIEGTIDGDENAYNGGR